MRRRDHLSEGRLTGQPWLSIRGLTDDPWRPVVGRVFWRDSSDENSREAREPNRLHDAVLRAMLSVGWRICSRRGEHLFAGEWRYRISGHRASRFCVRCLNAMQEGIYETEPTPSGQVRVTKVTPI